MVFTTSLKDIDSLRGVKRNYHGSRGPASSRTPLEHRVANKAMKVDVPRKGCELPRLKNGWWKYLDWFEDVEKTMVSIQNYRFFCTFSLQPVRFEDFVHYVCSIVTLECSTFLPRAVNSLLQGEAAGLTIFSAQHIVM